MGLFSALFGGGCKGSAAPWAATLSPESLNLSSLVHLCEALVGLNTDYLAEHMDIPLLYELGDAGVVRYIREPYKGGLEVGWKSVPWLLSADNARYDLVRRQLYYGADCKALACWRVAEMRILGDRNARALPIQEAERLFHIVAVPGNGKPAEDPSAALGMLPQRPPRRQLSR